MVPTGSGGFRMKRIALSLAVVAAGSAALYALGLAEVVREELGGGSPEL